MGVEYLIVGLGNPGQQYEDTRHNIGFTVLDYFAGIVGCRVFAAKWQGLYCEFRSQGQGVCLLKPQTYMNRSGECVVRFAHFYKVPLERILVVHDDLDLELGRIKVTAGGGAGGHNGIRSLIQHLGGQQFPRIRFGIGRPQRLANGEDIPVEKFVLSRFSPADERMVIERLDRCCEALTHYLQGGIDRAMSAINCLG